MLYVYDRITVGCILFQIVGQPFHIALRIRGITGKGLRLDKMDIPHIPRIGSAGSMQVQYLAFGKFSLQNRIHELEIKPSTLQIPDRIFRKGINIVVAKSRINREMNLLIAGTPTVTGIIKSPYPGIRLIEDITGNHHTVELFEGIARKSLWSAGRPHKGSRQPVHSLYVVKLIAFRRHIKMRIRRYHYRNIPNLCPDRIHQATQCG